MPGYPQSSGLGVIFVFFIFADLPNSMQISLYTATLILILNAFPLFSKFEKLDRQKNGPFNLTFWRLLWRLAVVVNPEVIKLHSNNRKHAFCVKNLKFGDHRSYCYNVLKVVRYEKNASIWYVNIKPTVSKYICMKNIYYSF